MRRQKGKGWMHVRGREFWECSRLVEEFLGSVSSGSMWVKAPPVGPGHTKKTWDKVLFNQDLREENEAHHDVTVNFSGFWRNNDRTKA